MARDREQRERAEAKNAALAINVGPDRPAAVAATPKAKAKTKKAATKKQA